MESLGYVLMYFLRGNLPWKEVKGATQEKYEKIRKMKMGTPVEVLCKVKYLYAIDCCLYFEEYEHS
jgi:hypothetical protein